MFFSKHIFRMVRSQFSAPVLGQLLIVFLFLEIHALARPDAASSAAHAQRTARALEAARGNPLELHAFLEQMPKGADLHNHLTGAVYAESWIRTAAEDGLCVDLGKLGFVPAETAANGSGSPVCGQGAAPVKNAYSDEHLYDSLIESLSMRDFVSSTGISAHDHFFDTFSKFRGTNPAHTGEWIDEVAGRAASQNEQYLELMLSPVSTHSTDAANNMPWTDDFRRLREQLLASGLRDDVAATGRFIDNAEKLRQDREHCGGADASAACQVRANYQCEVLRAFPKEQVFARTLLCFELASSDPRFVGINFVQPEDDPTAMADYGLHMRIVAFFHEIYPKVHISLHAGELAPGLVPPGDLCCHIRLAVDVAHAERIGHGVDVMYEDRPYELLKEMAAKHVLVEINLTSNDLILGINGGNHPFPIYRKFGVPVAISTDDEGVSRIDITHEYVRAVQTYNLRYADLKQMARASLEHSFLPGDSLWRNEDHFAALVAPCAADAAGADKPSSECETFLNASDRARQQWELERRFRHFESNY